MAGSFEIMGIDTQLVADGAYFAVEDGAEIVGCGGWGRATLFGGDHPVGRNTGLPDPARDAARVRARHTHPAPVRRGIGRMALDVCETAARSEGFARRAGDAGGRATLPHLRYVEIERFSSRTSNGVEVPLIRMGKTLSD